MSMYANDYPAAWGGTITQGHADYCAEHGHKSVMEGGRHVGFCGRCGDLLPIPAAHLRPGHVISIMGSSPVTVDAVTAVGPDHVAVHYGDSRAWLLSNDAPMHLLAPAYS